MTVVFFSKARSKRPTAGPASGHVYPADHLCDPVPHVAAPGARSVVPLSEEASAARAPATD